jgi:uncharacterized protein YqeY
MSLLEKIQSDIKEAMKAGDQEKVSALRMVVAASNNARIEMGQDLSDDDIVKIVQKECRECVEAIEAARTAGRTELVEKNKIHKEALEGYLPEQMSKERLEEIIVQTIHEIGASSPSDMGKVMSAVMPKVRGQADGALVSQLVSSHLGT